MRVYPYGVCLAVSACMGIALLIRQCAHARLRSSTASILSLTAIPLMLLCSRLFFCLFRFSWFLDKGVVWFFRFDEGGLEFFGGLAGGLLALLITARITKQSTWRLMDAAAAPGMLTYGLIRLSDLAAHQGYGWPVADWFSVDAADPEEFTGMSLFHLEDASFFERLPFAIEDPYYGDWRWAVCVLVALLAFLLLFRLLTLKTRREGTLSLTGLGMLLSLTAICESLRQDDVTKWGVAGVIKAGEVMAAVCLALLLALALMRARARIRRGQLVMLPAAALCCMGVILAMEFALEKKISFLTFLPMDMCYLIIIIASFAIAWVTGRAAFLGDDADP